MCLSSRAMFALSLLLAVAAAQAVESSTSKDSSMPADAVWKKIGDFCGIAAWHPAIAKCDLSTDKQQRTLTLKGGGSIVERLVRWNSKSRSYTYRIVSGPLPVVHYQSTLRVVAAKHGTGSVLTWSGHYGSAKGTSDSDAKKTIDGIYESGLAALADSPP